MAELPLRLASASAEAEPGLPRAFGASAGEVSAAVRIQRDDSRRPLHFLRTAPCWLPAGSAGTRVGDQEAACWGNLELVKLMLN
ncbi:uncharacterized protein ACA1_285600 [Acanthamoeba castellanii str. Neff]|uniref:Uncharacterized protein n=1 Tax=Acanthamoeba castellanii (strain ATCC 30010 / Neff) TaxID=1257118 RepID=L8H9V8_ACACF|nr:uncharacterized protein ACA1_285600 [Acanthamoeba castellanii str. Neff]ELR21201.1 hypothetical protein ACA1_285600 [Acanthamoeba castellanii str. Neff]